MAHSNLGKLYLIPVPIAEVDHRTCLPEYNRELLPTIRHYIVENIRSARRFLKAADRDIDIDSITFYELNKHTPEGAIGEYLRPAQAGEPVGVISEAGCPAVADPGADVVALAQRLGIEVVPLVGPSSILMALMGSGFNGQGFAFVGYLPIEDARRVHPFHARHALHLSGRGARHDEREVHGHRTVPRRGEPELLQNPP